jgi:hypothetical protein
LNQLKDHYLKLLPDLPAAEKAIESASSQGELQNRMDWIVSQGTLVRFKVGKIFSQKDDDDSDSDKPANPALRASDPQTLEIWNGAGTCAIPFQKGETYLVYATSDEETDRMETNICHRTARVSDAGDDLAYLYFLPNGGAQSTRLEGFVTSDMAHLLQDWLNSHPKGRMPDDDDFVLTRGSGR